MIPGTAVEGGGRKKGWGTLALWRAPWELSADPGRMTKKKARV